MGDQRGQRRSGRGRYEAGLEHRPSRPDNATLTSPIAGTVTAVPFAGGSAMTTGDAIRIIGTGSIQLTADVPQTSVGSLKVGQRAAVSVGGGTPSAATVTAIGVLPSDSTSSTPSYPVTVTVSKPGPSLTTGSTATATVASAANAIVVPVSAITRTASGSATVTELSGTTTRTVRVGLGPVGDTMALITSGLSVGERIVLADTTQVLPSSNVKSSGLGGGAGRTGGSGTTAGGGTRRARSGNG